MPNLEVGNRNREISIKDAIVACAREEIKKAIFDICSVNGRNYHSKRQCSPTRRNNDRKTLSCQRRRKQLSQRSRTACEVAPENELHYNHTVSAVTKEAYRSISKRQHEKNKGSKSCCIDLTPVHENVLSGKELMGELKGMSECSSMLLNKSAELMLKVGGRCANDIAEKIDQFEEEFKNSAKVEEKEKSEIPGREGPHVQNILRREIRTAPVQSQSFHDIRPRPTTSHASSRTRVRPSTALERRRAQTRPSTAMLVRAKTENLGRRLLGSINLNTTRPASVSSLPNKLEEGEWENELAKHIVSLYNNKIVSEIQGEHNFKAKTESLSPEECSKFNDEVSMHTPSLSSSAFLFSGSSLSLKGSSEKDKNLPVFLNAVKDETPSRESAPSRTTRIVKNSKPQMIWFVGTGIVHNDWIFPENLVNCCFDGDINKVLRQIEKSGKYMQYIKLVEEVIGLNIQQNPQHDEGEVTEEMSLWRNLVLTSNSFGVKLIDRKKYPKALEMLGKAENLIAYDGILSHEIVLELKALVQDSYAYYYAKRNKPSAALQYILSASAIQKRRKDMLNLAKCYLHRAFILQQLDRFGDVMKCMQRVLKMVEEGSLNFNVNTSTKSGTKQEIGNNPQAVVLVAVTYHNIAVQQIILGHIGDACISSQNARRLARNCLSLSNRYVVNFEDTHMKALSEMSSILRYEYDNDEALVFRKLLGELFD